MTWGNGSVCFRAAVRVKYAALAQHRRRCLLAQERLFSSVGEELAESSKVSVS